MGKEEKPLVEEDGIRVHTCPKIKGGVTIHLPHREKH